MADESLSRSSSNSLTNMLSKTSRRKKDSGSEGSVGSTIERLKGHTVTEEDIGENGLGKLLSKGLGRRRKKQQREEEQRAIEEAARGRSVADRGTLENELHDHRKSSPGHGDGETSSVVTYDSDTESAHATPPPLSTHPSHIGYLTTSSPLVKATTLPDTSSLAGLDAQLDEIATTPRASKFPPTDTVAASESNSDPVPGSTLRAPTDGSHKRTASPVGRLKEALHPRRATSPKSNSSQERKAGGGGAAASIKEKEKSATADNRRGSVASRIGSIFPDRQSPHSSAASSPERPRTGKVSAIDTNIRPQTPPPGDNTAPIIVNTPPTPTDTGSPRFSNQDSASPDSAAVNTNVVTSPSGNMISHRRIRSGSATALGPSKLSNITTAPLTPTLENASSPGQGGFFSSVFSAAQNAANTLSSSIANTSVAPDKARSRSGTQDLKEVESPVVETLGENTNSEVPTEEKEPAVKTLGMGDLSLSHLGIAETASGGNTPVASKFGESHETRGRSESTMSEEAFANRAVAAAQGMGGDNMSRVTTSEVEDGQSLARPRSVYDSMPGEQTPPNGSVFEGKAGIHRSGSIRSAMGNRRKRGSSAATGHSTIGAAIAAANGALTRPAVTEGEPAKITGFAVASKKRNRDFHNLFRSVPDDDYLIEDYSCALQREILAHGRLYVSEGHLCFSSNIFGWVTTLVMSFDEIVSVEKRSTALLFKNGLMISTLHAKNVFASFTSRDSTYDLIVGIWKLGHPSLRSSLNGVRIEETGGGDKTEKDDGAAEKGSQSSGEESGSEDGEVYDEDDDTGDGDSDGESFVQAEGLAPSDAGEKVVSRKPSTGVVKTGTPAEKTKESTAPTAGLDFPGPATHAPTDCTDHDTHYDIILADEIIPAPLGKVYSLMFGQASLTWMKNWLTDDQKCLELTMDDQTKPLNMENKVRTYSYIKPLNGSIGPKQTKCLCSENLDSMDLDKAVSVTISTQTPDVPSGNVFSIKTKYCLSWAEGNGTRLQMNCTIEWTGKSWLKGPIEKGSKDGQIKFAKEIVASLKAAVSSRRGTTTPTAGAKSKKKGRKGRDAKGGLNKATDGASDTKAQSEDWGLAEPLRSIFGPLVDIIKPLLTGNILYGILVGLLVASWFGFGFTGRGGGGRGDLGFLGTPQRIAAYEEIWRKEESELWDWLEERVGMDRARQTTKASFPRKDLEDRLKDEKMDDREVEAAIKVTEEKLRVLKGVVEKKKKANLEKFGETYVQEKDAPENISQ